MPTSPNAEAATFVAGHAPAAELSAKRTFTATGGWAHAVEPGKGLMLEKLPAEWRESLQSLAEDGSGAHAGCITLPKLAAAARRQAAAERLDNGKIPLDGFPDHVHIALRAFDLDGRGEIDAAGLMHAAVLFEEAKKTEGRLVRVAAGLLVVIIIMCAAMTGLTYAVVEGSKEVRTVGAQTPEGQVLATVGSGPSAGSPIAVVSARVNIPLGALPYVPQMWPEIEAINMHLKGSATRMMVRVAGIVTKSADGMNITTVSTAAGITVTLSDVLNVAVTHTDGSQEAFCGLCGSCSAMSVVRTDLVTSQIALFHREAEEARRPGSAHRRAKTLCWDIMGENVGCW